MVDVKRSGSRCGVRYAVTDDDQWYRLDDVIKILDLEEDDISLPEGESDSFSIRYEGERSYTNGVKFVTSSGLSTIVDQAVGEDYLTMRGLWITGWYEDLTYYAEFGSAFDGMLAGSFSESILEFADGVAKPAVEKALSEQSSRIYVVTAKLNKISEDIESAQTYLSGFGNGLNVVKSDTMPGDPLYQPNDDLSQAQIDLSDAIDRLYRIASGDGDDD